MASSSNFDIKGVPFGKIAALQKIVFLLAHFFLILGFALGQESSLFTDYQSGNHPVDYQIFSKSNQIAIPFSYINGFIVLEVDYGKRKLPLRFIFDTGSTYSIITHKEIVLLSGSKLGRHIFVYGSDLMTKIDANIITNNQLELGTIGFNQVDMILLNDLFLDFGKYVGLPIHGILGGSFFSQFIVEIDYKHEYLILHNPKGKRPISTQFKKIPSHFSSLKPYVEMKVTMNSGQTFTGTYLVDTGASLALLLIINSHPSINIPEKTIVTRIASGLGGQIEGFMGRVKEIELANKQITPFGVHFYRRQDTLQRKPLNGIVGNKVLALHRVLIDYPNREIYLKPLKRKKVRENKSGLSIIASGPFLKSFQIEQVLERTPGHRAGLLVGDKILSINGWPISMLGMELVYKKLSKRAGKKIKMVILRDGKKMKIAFRLKAFI